ncbi:oxidoreductase [Actinocorallia longicatena]|uniref:SDR family NAD(P)-dependent oxidoreductase n=1 Tax=Actinocorallia longicatena TaxID=111803 RepID=A0ABP6QKV1_9ACTN
MTKWKSSDIPDQTGRTFVVTGANSGLGLETTRALAAHGAHVIMAVRDQAKGRAALERLDGNLELRQLDLADLDSVHAFAETVTKVDVLVNNAGVMMPPRTLTQQGFELQLGTNHLAHFALTGLLLGKLAKGDAPRVVTVSSGLASRGKIDFDDLNGAKSYSPTTYYAQSKLANQLFTLELARRLATAGLPVTALMAHPGYAATNLQSTGPRGLMNLLMKPSNLLLAQSAAMGALPQLYAATAPGVKPGEYYGPDGLGDMRGHPKLVRPVKAATDEAAARRFWELSEKLTGVEYP